MVTFVAWILLAHRNASAIKVAASKVYIKINKSDGPQVILARILGVRLADAPNAIGTWRLCGSPSAGYNRRLAALLLGRVRLRRVHLFFMDTCLIVNQNTSMDHSENLDTGGRTTQICILRI
jgi:hypothetical protein